MPRMIACEKYEAGKWRPVTVTDEPRGVTLRCAVCHGPVKFHCEAQTGSHAAHFEHFRRHVGCPLSDKYDGNGVRSHPMAVS